MDTTVVYVFYRQVCESAGVKALPFEDACLLGCNLVPATVANDGTITITPEKVARKSREYWPESAKNWPEGYPWDKCPNHPNSHWVAYENEYSGESWIECSECEKE